MLPVSDDGSRQRALCEWDSQFPGYGFHLRSIYRDGFVLTRYEPPRRAQPNGLEEKLAAIRRHRDAKSATTVRKASSTICAIDPLQWENLWNASQTSNV